MSEEIIEQKKGLDHIRHIFDTALDMWGKEFDWTNELNDCIKIALERHRKSLVKENREENKKCLGCGGDISVKGLYECNNSSYCIICWRKTFLNRGHACL